MDTNIQPTKTELTPMHDKTKNATQKMISVKSAVCVAGIIILLALAFYHKGLFVAAMVNGSPVSRLAVIHELESIAGKETIDSLINKKLVGDEARQKGIAITDSDVLEEIKKIEDQIKAQGMTLDKVLASKNMTLEKMKEQILFQKEVEKLLSDKLTITDDEITKFISNSKGVAPKGEENAYREQVKKYLYGQKLNAEAGPFVETLRSKAHIQYFVSY